MAGRRHGGNENKGDEGRRRPGPDTLEERFGKAADSRISAYIRRRCGEPGSSGSTVSGYGLDDRAIEVRSRQGQRIFRLSSVTHPTSCTVGTGGPFPGGKARPERDADHSTPSSAEVMNE
jgi:hypothetical protein